MFVMNRMQGFPLIRESHYFADNPLEEEGVNVLADALTPKEALGAGGWYFNTTLTQLNLRGIILYTSRRPLTKLQSRYIHERATYMYMYVLVA
jgi:hypothetical protein